MEYLRGVQGMEYLRGVQWMEYLRGVRDTCEMGYRTCVREVGVPVRGVGVHVRGKWGTCERRGVGVPLRDGG